jgi:hypothetical protein
MFTEFSTMQQQQLHHSRLIRGVSLHGGVDCSQPYLASYVIDKSLERVTSPKAAQQPHVDVLYFRGARAHKKCIARDKPSLFPKQCPIGRGRLGTGRYHQQRDVTVRHLLGIMPNKDDCG